MRRRTEISSELNVKFGELVEAGKDVLTCLKTLASSTPYRYLSGVSMRLVAGPSRSNAKEDDADTDVRPDHVEEDGQGGDDDSSISTSSAAPATVVDDETKDGQGSDASNPPTDTSLVDSEVLSPSILARPRFFAPSATSTPTVCNY